MAQSMRELLAGLRSFSEKELQGFERDFDFSDESEGSDSPPVLAAEIDSPSDEGSNTAWRLKKRDSKMVTMLADMSGRCTTKNQQISELQSLVETQKLTICELNSKLQECQRQNEVQRGEHLEALRFYQEKEKGVGHELSTFKLKYAAADEQFILLESKLQQLTKSLESSEEARRQLQRKLEEEVKMNTALNEQVQYNSSQIAQKEREFMDIASSYKLSTQQLSVFKDSSEQLSTRVAEYERAYHGAKLKEVQFDSVKSELTSALKTIEDLRGRVAELAQDKKDVERLLGEARAQYIDVQESHLIQKRRLEEENSKKRREEVEFEVSTRVTLALAEMRGKLQSKEDEICRLNRSMNEKCAELLQVSGEAEISRTLVEKLKDEYRALEFEFKEQLLDLRKRNDHLREKLNVYECLESEVDRVIVGKAQVGGEPIDDSNLACLLTAPARRIQHAIAMAQDSLHLQNKVRSLELELQHKTQDLLETKAELHRLQLSLANAEQPVGYFTMSLLEKEKELAQCRVSIDTLKDELRRVGEDNLGLRDELERLLACKEQVKRLMEEIQEMKCQPKHRAIISPYVQTRPPPQRETASFVGRPQTEAGGVLIISN